MSEQAYELTALAMRYWFTGLMAVACLCGLRLLILDRRQARRERQAAPNMEYVGELLVVRGSESVPRGERYAVQQDFVIGRRRKCDVCLADRSVFPRHARGELRSGGMLIGAIGRAPVSLRGQPASREVLVRDGALFCIGELTLQLTLYDVPVEYVPGSRRSIDATDAGGDGFDEEAPFEHEFDDEFNSPRDALDEWDEPDAAPGEPSAEWAEPDDLPDELFAARRRPAAQAEPDEWAEPDDMPDGLFAARRRPAAQAKPDEWDEPDDLPDELFAARRRQNVAQAKPDEWDEPNDMPDGLFAARRRPAAQAEPDEWDEPDDLPGESFAARRRQSATQAKPDEWDKPDAMPDGLFAARRRPAAQAEPDEWDEPDDLPDESFAARRRPAAQAEPDEWDEPNAMPDESFAARRRPAAQAEPDGAPGAQPGDEYLRELAAPPRARVEPLPRPAGRARFRIGRRDRDAGAPGGARSTGGELELDECDEYALETGGELDDYLGGADAPPSNDRAARLGRATRS